MSWPWTGSDRPASLPQDACGQVSLALTMSQASASCWTDLAVTLGWRLPQTGAALRSGRIDLSRARTIAEATAVLDEENARAVESRILPRAGEQTLGQLRAALRRAVISADPRGADRRREEAERHAKVTLYPDAEGTATLAGYNLPGIRATAALARITALAQALKASGADGGIDLLRSKVLLGLLLGTLPYIPPPPDGPHDDGCPPDNSYPPDSNCLPDRGCPPDDGCPPGEPPPGEPLAGEPPPGEPTAGEPLAGEPLGGGSPADTGSSDDASEGNAGARPSPWPDVAAFVRPGPAAMGHLLPAGGGFLDLKAPWSALTGHGIEPGYLSRLGAITPAQASHLAQLAARDPAVSWQVIVTRPDGRALAAATIRRRSARAGPGPPARSAAPQPARQRADHCGLVRRVTVTITQGELTAELATPAQTAGLPADLSLPSKLAQVLATASAAAGQAARMAAADTAAAGCAHTQATTAYQPPPRLRDYITARDITCRFPTCRQPATRCDLDHTTPYDQGGKTCTCNIGALCRHHH